MQTQRSGIHQTAQVSPRAELGSGVVIGPGSVVGPRVRLGDDCVLHANVVVDGDTWLGPACELFPFAVVGMRPQDKKVRQQAGTLREEGWLDGDGRWFGPLRIGAGNEIRESVTIHGGTPWGHGITRIGDRNLFLAGSHVGHDSRVGNDCVFTNGAMVAGHSVVEDHAILGAMSGVHQFARVGRYAMVGAGAMLSHDAPPFALVQGDRARLVSVNKIGLRRAGFPVEQVALLKRAYRILFWRSGLLEERMVQARAFAAGDPLVEEVLAFVEASERGICVPRSRPVVGDEPVGRS